LKEIAMSTATVAEVMTRKVVAVSPGTGYKQIVDVLAEFAVSAVPVVDADLHVLGVVSEADLLHKVEFAGDEVHARLLDRPGRRAAKAKAIGDTAAELMTEPVVTTGPDATIGEAARLMDQRHVKRLPVVDADGRLTGIVSRRDLLRPYLRPDSDIRGEVIGEVLEHTLGIEPDTIQVAVSGGRVTLSGRADRHSTAKIAARLTAAVDGVVGVDDELTWAFDDTAELRRRYMFTPS
jgi:CBS domain-containing protein